MLLVRLLVATKHVVPTDAGPHESNQQGWVQHADVQALSLT